MNNDPVARRPGRRGGTSDTRQEILSAARAQFTEVGYRTATMRMIAADAGVDPALINYYFGSKQQLFGEAFALRANPAVIIAEKLDGPIADLPRRLVTALVETWDNPKNRPTLLAITDSGPGPGGPALVRGFVEEVLAAPIAERLQANGVAAGDARVCSALLVTQLVGIIYARYVLAAAPVTAVPRTVFVDRFTPALTAILDQYVATESPA